MSIVKPELSKANRYWISKHRYYELYHFCLQYYEWEKEYMYNTIYAKTFSVIFENDKTN